MPLCRQGVDVPESGKLFSDWLYVELCSAVSLSRDNGLNCGAVNNVPTYYREIVTKLSCDQVETLESHLRILFNQTAPAPAGSTSDWSHDCQSRGLLLGHIFVIGRQGIDLIFAALSLCILPGVHNPCGERSIQPAVTIVQTAKFIYAWVLLTSNG